MSSRRRRTFIRPILYSLSMVPTFLIAMLIPITSNTIFFMPLSLAFRYSAFLPLGLIYMLPDWGIMDPRSDDDMQAAYNALFCVFALLSGSLYYNSTLAALLQNTTESRSFLHRMTREGDSPLEGSPSVANKIFAAIGDHPVVNAAVWDVLLSGLSLGVWASARDLDLCDILSRCCHYARNLLAPEKHAGCTEYAEKVQEKKV